MLNEAYVYVSFSVCRDIYVQNSYYNHLLAMNLVIPMLYTNNKYLQRNSHFFSPDHAQTSFLEH